MNIFIVERQGVYGQGVIGAYSTEEKAISAAKSACEDEPDDYHYFDIDRLAIDETSFTSKREDSSSFYIGKVSRKDGVVNYKKN